MFEANLVPLVKEFNDCTKTGQLSCGCSVMNGEVISLCPEHGPEIVNQIQLNLKKFVGPVESNLLPQTS